MKEELPKEEWGPGPWQGEPDHFEWVDKETDLTCVAHRNMHVTGSWCGYVGVPEAHPAYGLNYGGESQEDYDARMEAFRKGGLGAKLPKSTVIPGIGEAIYDIRVHGGLTYSGEAYWNKKDSKWYFGFDCGHFDDFTPMMNATMILLYKELGKERLSMGIGTAMPWGGVVAYKTLDYVRSECSDLADKLSALDIKSPLLGELLNKNS